jgi:hypothetical protein
MSHTCNVVALEAHRPERSVEEAARTHLEKIKVFAKTSGPAFYDLEKMRKGDVLVVDNVANRALMLAGEHNFLEMCLPILWGDEKQVHLQQFGELLRGAVITFHPLTVFELHLVKNIVAAQWRLSRLYQTQTNVYENDAKSGEIGKYGLPAAAHSAMEMDEALYRAQAALNVAIKTHAMAVRTSVKSMQR